MAKTRKLAAPSPRETGEKLSVVRDAIETAIAKIEKRAKALPAAARDERRVLMAAMVALDLTAKATKLHCGPRWFFLPK